MRISGADVLALGHIPSPQYPSQSLGYVEILHTCIGFTDTVSVSESYGVDDLYGMILLTAHDKDRVVSDIVPCHPYIHNYELQNPPIYFKVQLYIIKKYASSQIVMEWPHLNPDLPDTIPAAAPSNCVLWIHASQIVDLALFPHSIHCVNQIDGNLSGRHEVFHVDHYVFLHDDNDDLNNITQFESVSPTEYNMFGHPYQHHFTGYVSFTERIHESLCQLSKTSSAMLIKTGNINQRAHKKTHIPWESWKYIYSKLHLKQGVLNVSKVSAKVRTPITTDNLTLSVARTTTKKFTVVAKDVAGFEVLRSLITRIGLGVKKRHPKLSTIEARDGSNIRTVQEQDTIHVVDIDSNQVLYRDADSDGYDSDTTQSPPTNWIRLTYDYASKQIGITIKCYSSVVSLLSSECRRYLHSNNIISREEYVLHEGQLWKVLKVSRETNETLLCNPSNVSETITVCNDDIADENRI